jgi:tripartite-type tricarboxylate transporter receptor subunit TctC
MLFRLFLAALLAACTPAYAQGYPAKPIRFITPYAPGGSTSILARLVGQKLTESWGQSVIVDNRPGASTIIGTEALAKASPDGYTILLVSVDCVLIPQLIRTSYDILKDFAPVATLGSSNFILVVHPSVPAGNLQEFIALARSRPGQLNYASAGGGTVSHLVAELFDMMTGISMQHVPYKGGGPALTDLVGGQVQLLFVPPATTIPFVRGGRLKAMAVSGDARIASLPQVPTFAEAGLPAYDPKQWYGVLAPAGTPRAIIDKLSAEIGRILAIPEIREKLDVVGMEPFVSTPAQMAAMMKADMARYGKVIKTANIRIEN